MVQILHETLRDGTTNNEVAMPKKPFLAELVRSEFASIIVGGRERNSYVTVGEAKLEKVRDEKGRVFETKTPGTTKIQPLGWMSHPLMDYISPEWRLSKVTYDLINKGPGNYAISTISDHTLAWSRGEGTVFADINNEDGTKMTQAQMYEILGVVENFSNPARWAKRVSRALSVQYKPGQWGIFAPRTFTVVESELLDEKAWDGSNAISRKDFNKLITRLMYKLGTPQAILDAAVKELLKYNRFSLTLMTSDGQQFKGHLVVLDYLPETDGITIYTHKGAGKKEFGITKFEFFGVQAVKAHDHMDLDRQSLINLHHFFGNENLIKWLNDERKLIIEAIRNNDVAELLDRTGKTDKVSNLEKLENWLLASYATAGGNIMWFRSMVRQAGKTYKDKIKHTRSGGMRMPIPGGRAYVFTDSVFIDVVRVACEHVGMKQADTNALVDYATSEFSLKSGTVRVVEEYSAIIIPTSDWNDVSAISGGADQDDGYWLFGFTDTDGTQKVLFWRSPNARGEYLLATEDGNFFHSYPQMDSSKLPPRIDTLPNKWLELPKEEANKQFKQYTPYRLRKEIERSIKTMGHLGKFVNATSYEAWLNESTLTSYRQEVVVDGTQKDGQDTTPALDNAKSVISKRVLIDKAPVSPIVYDRIKWCLNGIAWEELLELYDINVTTDSWLDHLMEAVVAQLDIFDAELEELAKEAFPPVELFVAGQKYAKEGADLVRFYSNEVTKQGKLAQTGERFNMDSVREETEKYLFTKYEGNSGDVLLGAAAQIYANSAERDSEAKDSLLWLMGPKDLINGGRKAGIGNTFIAMLQSIGVLNEYHVVASEDGYGEIEQKQFTTTSKPIAITVTSAWYGVMLAKQGKESSGYVSDALKAQYVNELETIAPKMVGLDIELRVENINGTDKLLAYSTRSNRKIGFANVHHIPTEQLVNRKLNIKFNFFSRINATGANLILVAA